MFKNYQYVKFYSFLYVTITLTSFTFSTVQCKEAIEAEPPCDVIRTGPELADRGDRVHLS